MGRGRPGTGVDALRTCIRVRFTWDGQRRVETLDLKPTVANIKAAERLVATIKQEIEVGAFDYAKHFPKSANVPVDTKSFERHADLFLATRITAHSTKLTYAVGVRKWKRIFAGKDIAAIKPTDISTAVAAMSPPLSATSVNAYLAVLRGIFDMAVDDKLISRSPTERIKRMKVQRPEPDPLTLAEISVVLTYLHKHTPEIGLFFEFAILTGLRPSEQIALRWSKIDWRSKTAKIDVAFVRRRDKTTKSNRIRHIDLSPRAIGVLTKLKVYTFMVGLDAHIFVRPTTREPWRTNDDLREKFWHPALRAVGIRLRDAYQTRHTFATALLMAGVHPHYIAEQLGHANVGTTLDHYAKWLAAEDNGRMAKMASDVFGQRAVTTKPNTLTVLNDE